MKGRGKRQRHRAQVGVVNSDELPTVRGMKQTSIGSRLLLLRARCQAQQLDGSLAAQP